MERSACSTVPEKQLHDAAMGDGVARVGPVLFDEGEEVFPGVAVPYFSLA